MKKQVQIGTWIRIEESGESIKLCTSKGGIAPSLQLLPPTAVHSPLCWRALCLTLFCLSLSLLCFPSRKQTVSLRTRSSLNVAEKPTQPCLCPRLVIASCPEQEEHQETGDSPSTTPMGTASIQSPAIWRLVTYATPFCLGVMPARPSNLSGRRIETICDGQDDDTYRYTTPLPPKPNNCKIWRISCILYQVNKRRKTKKREKPSISLTNFCQKKKLIVLIK